MTMTPLPTTVDETLSLLEQGRYVAHFRPGVTPEDMAKRIKTLLN